MTHYTTLGVPEQATADEIKRAYRKLASQHHPDKGGDKAKFQEIQSAYDTLSDPQKRQQYDMQRNGFGGREFRFTSGHGPDIDAIFRNFGFGGDPFGGFRQQQRRNKDLKITITVSLESTLEDQTKTVQVKTTNDDVTTVEVKIPRGISSGTQIKYSGLGDNLFNTLPRGDLYVQIGVTEHENYITNGIDLYTQVNVNCLLAIVGGKITVTGLDNKQFEINLPPGIQPGTKFRIPEQGVYQLNSAVRGNLYIEVALTVPQDLSEEALNSIKSIINPL